MSHTPGPGITENTMPTPNELYEIIKNSSGTWAGRGYRPTYTALIAALPMLAVLEELDECAEYWSEYDVPLGLHDRIKESINQARGE